jgi:hypothetical protein
VTTARVYVVAVLLVVLAFAGSFALARALRDEPQARTPVPVMSEELVELGPVADLPPLRGQAP